MFVWRKRASAAWLAANEMTLREIADPRLVVVSESANKNAIAEITGSNRRELEKLKRRFGGRIEKLPRDWLKTFLQAGASKPLRIGKRLLIASSGTSNSRSLVIPAGAAFGTGEHATTATSLRLLERLTRIRGAQAASLHVSAASRNLFEKCVSSASCRRMRASRLRFPEKGFSLLDVGTGSGILALAAKRFGAGKVIAIDNDPVAIRVAKTNARRNRIAGLDFRVADVRHWKFPARIEIVTANLFSELLIEILPQLKCAGWLILSGILHEQEPSLVHALKQNRIAVVERRCTGKWIAILARRPIMSSRAQARDLTDLVDHAI